MNQPANRQILSLTFGGWFSKNTSKVFFIKNIETGFFVERKKEFHDRI